MKNTARIVSGIVGAAILSLGAFVPAFAYTTYNNNGSSYCDRYSPCSMFQAWDRDMAQIQNYSYTTNNFYSYGYTPSQYSYSNPSYNTGYNTYPVVPGYIRQPYQVMYPQQQVTYPTYNTYMQPIPQYNNNMYGYTQPTQQYQYQNSYQFQYAYSY